MDGLNGFRSNRMSGGRVVSLVLQEAGTYNTMYSRPLQTSLDGRSLNTIVERVAQHGNNKPAASIFAGIAVNFLSPSVTPEIAVPIYNGWNESRLKFVLEVEVASSVGGVISYFIQGFTNYCGVSSNNHIDPNMIFMVNSISTITREEIRTPVGIQIREYMADCSHIIVDSAVMATDLNYSAPQYLMRPVDLYSVMQKNFLTQGFTGAQNNYTHDFRAMTGSIPQRSSRDMLMPSNYISKMISGYSSAVEETPIGVNNTGILDTAIGYTRELPLSENGFIAAFMDGGGVNVANKFTYANLLNFDANAVSVTNYLRLGPTAKMQLPNAGSTAYWNATDRETHAATILSQSVVSLMLELLISKIVFRSTNHDQMGRMNTVVIAATSLSRNPIENNVEIFKHRLENELLFDLTFGNQDSYILEMTCDAYGTTTLSLGFGSNTPTVYTTPSFCDSTFTSVISHDIQNLERVSMDFQMLNDHISDATRNVAPGNMYGINENF